MILTDLSKKLSKVTIDNSPQILTAIGVAGVIGTAVLSSKATWKAQQYLVTKDGFEVWTDPSEYSSKEKVKMVWKLYLPAIATGTATVVCIVIANRIGSRRAAALAIAYGLTEKAYDEYRDKVVEKFGEAQEQKVRDEIAQDQINQKTLDKEIVLVGPEVLCFETLSGRYFSSDLETIRRAVNDINFMIIKNMYATLGEFYDLVGLPDTDISDEVGWNTDNLMDVRYSTVLAKDGRPCISISYNYTPVRTFRSLH